MRALADMIRRHKTQPDRTSAADVKTAEGAKKRKERVVSNWVKQLAWTIKDDEFARKELAELKRKEGSRKQEQNNATETARQAYDNEIASKQSQEEQTKQAGKEMEEVKKTKLEQATKESVVEIREKHSAAAHEAEALEKKALEEAAKEKTKIEESRQKLEDETAAKKKEEERLKSPLTKLADMIKKEKQEEEFTKSQPITKLAGMIKADAEADEKEAFRKKTIVEAQEKYPSKNS